MSFLLVSPVTVCVVVKCIILQLLLDVLSAVLVACAANYWLIIPAIAIVTLLVLIRHYFLHASRDVQRIESIGNREFISVW